MTGAIVENGKKGEKCPSNQIHTLYHDPTFRKNRSGPGVRGGPGKRLRM